MLSRLFPPEFNFFNMFDEQANHAVQAAALFKEIARSGPVGAPMVERMREIEHQGDDAAHAIIDRLNRTFVTPFDREDICTLAKELDDVTDMLNAITRRMHVYKLSGGGANLIKFADVIDESVRTLAVAVKGLRNVKNSHATHEACVEVHRLENVGDTFRDAMLAELFETEPNPILVIKWKEIYQNAETALDLCEDVANVIESIVVKHT